MTKFLFALSLILTSCSVYQSDGRKVFLNDGERLVTTASFDPLTEPEPLALQSALTSSCEDLSDTDLLLYFNDDMTFWRAADSTYLYGVGTNEEFLYQLKVPKSTQAPVTLCWF